MITTQMALWPYRYYPFVFAAVVLSLPIIRAMLESRKAERRRQQKAAADAARKEALAKAREAAREKRLQEVAEEERERLRVREEEKARRKAEREAAREAAKAAQPKRPRGRPRKNPPPEPKRQESAAQPTQTPASFAPKAQPEPAKPEPEKPCWPPRDGNGQFIHEHVAFTGTIRYMPIDEAIAAVNRNGGVGQQDFQPGLTTMLVTGDGADQRLIAWAREANARIVPANVFDAMVCQPYSLTPEQFAAIVAML